MTITSSEHFIAVRNALERIDTRQLDHVASAIEEAERIYTCGNGGSAATAMHFAGDLRSLGYAAFDLLSPVKVTQIGNDESYEDVFRSQVSYSGDLVIAFSGSGTSPNIASLCRVVPMMLFTSNMLTEDYGSPYHIRVDSTDYEVIEDVHLAMCHAIKKELKARNSATLH